MVWTTGRSVEYWSYNNSHRNAGEQTAYRESRQVESSNSTCGRSRCKLMIVAAVICAIVVILTVSITCGVVFGKSKNMEQSIGAPESTTVPTTLPPPLPPTDSSTKPPKPGNYYFNELIFIFQLCIFLVCFNGDSLVGKADIEKIYY